jgi:hypothetical protein
VFLYISWECKRVAVFVVRVIGGRRLVMLDLIRVFDEAVRASWYMRRELLPNDACLPH